ncbi:MAG: protein kinase domain-containing protein [Gemmatimonadota bacterium]
MTNPSAEFLDLQAALAGEYSLQCELGRGGMGVVYLARDVQLDRDVAIKVLPAHLARMPEARERFKREARTAAGLSHPHIVPIHRVSEVGGFVFLVMSYVAGETLGERLRTNGPLPPDEAARVMREVAWALAYAHGRGIVHRDVKPDNILLEAGTGRALVTDFGIAQGGAADDRGTDLGRVMGTANFMSPEQAAGEPVDARSDIYALGVAGYLAVSGRLPFESYTLTAPLQPQAIEAAASVMRVAPGLPNALSAAIDRCLAPDPDDRFADCEELAAALAPPETRTALPPTLRAWLGARNPLLIPYMAWSGVFGTLTSVNLAVWLAGLRPDGPADIVLLAAITAAPLLPVFGFHLNQAHRLFKAGHSLADLRAALEVGRREQAETEAAVREDREPLSHRLLRVATVLSATWLGVTFGLILAEVIHENQGPMWLFLSPVGTTLLTGAISNALGVQFIPRRLRRWWQTGVRDRLWNSRAGERFAKLLGAPERSRAVGGGVFRATEVALGVAASELFEALPAAYREQLGDLPGLVRLLESRAAEARAEVESLAALAPSGDVESDILGARRKAAAAHLSETVAALEALRLDLLRLHAGAGDLAPLTTLMDAVRVAGDDINRLVEAQLEVEDAAQGEGTRGR